MIMQILDVMIGLTVVYVIFSTVASASLELIEAIVRKRGQLLLRGIDELFDAVEVGVAGTAQDMHEFLAAFYANPHISALFGGRLRVKTLDELSRRIAFLDGLRGTGAGKADQCMVVVGGRLPSYIPADRFASAIQSMAAQAGDTGTPAGKKTAQIAVLCRHIVTLANQLNLPASAAGVTDALEIERHKLAAFYEGSAERITGWYRRRVQWLLLIVGLVLAGAFNLDTVRIAKVLSEDPVIRSQLVEQALEDLRDQAPKGFQISCELAGSDATGGDAAPAPDDAAALSDAECEDRLREGINRRLRYANSLGLPIGWDQDPLVARLRQGDAPGVWLVGAGLLKALGCLLTALAICLGAPFWFDLLNKLANVRTAIKPPPPARKEPVPPA